MNDGVVIIVDEDHDDWEFLQDAWKELEFKNGLIFFDNAEAVLNYLKTEGVSPFLILCDVNLPKMDGFELKERIMESHDLRYKVIPFVFWSTTVSKEQIKKSYDLGGNGFFLKGSTFEEIKTSLVEIVKYWLKSKVPE